MSTPRGLAFDNDTESRDAWSVSMATPLSEQQVNLVELVDTANSSTSGDESYSSLSNVEHSGSCRMEQDDMKGEVISQKFLVKQETEKNDDCHRTPLAVSVELVDCSGQLLNFCGLKFSCFMPFCLESKFFDKIFVNY